MSTSSKLTEPEEEVVGLTNWQLISQQHRWGWSCVQVEDIRIVLIA